MSKEKYGHEISINGGDDMGEKSIAIDNDRNLVVPIKVKKISIKKYM